MRKPYYFVMRDSSLSSESVADNFEQMFQAFSKNTLRKKFNDWAVVCEILLLLLDQNCF